MPYINGLVFTGESLCGYFTPYKYGWKDARTVATGNWPTLKEQETLFFFEK